MDHVATRVISSALTMYDIMEKRITLVEQLEINRQPFSDMSVIYLVAPTVAAAKKISGDFETRAKAKYGEVHLFWLDTVSQRNFFEEFIIFNAFEFRSLLMFLPSFKQILCW
jgi:hypothetical protein